MKKLLVLALILCLCVFSCACTNNGSHVDNMFCLKTDISDVIYCLEYSQNLSTDNLNWCRFYELDYSEVFFIITQYRESDNQPFRYLLTIADADLDLYSYSVAANSREITLNQPAQASIKNLKEDNNRSLIQLDFYIQEISENATFYLVAKEDGTIERIAYKNSVPDNENLQAYDFNYNSQNKVEQVSMYEIGYNEIMNSSESFNHNYLWVYSYEYNQDGSLKQFNGKHRPDFEQLGYSISFTYSEGMRKTADYKNETITYTRDPNGLVTHLHSETDNNQEHAVDRDYHYSKEKITVTLN